MVQLRQTELISAIDDHRVRRADVDAALHHVVRGDELEVGGGAVAKLLPGHVEGQVLRVLDGVWKEKRTQLELKAWTEIFVVRQAP